VRVTVNGEQRLGIAHRWRGRWVYVGWSEGVGLNHLEWVLAEAVVRA
jgi:hypothetical protein